jgi:hypothetical protein
MTYLGATLAVFVAGAALAEGGMAAFEADQRPWVPLDGEEVHAAPAGRTLLYPDSGARQTFHASGRTHYVFGGQESWGRWRIEDEAYCSTWPPSDLWACYDMSRFEDRLRIVAPGPDVTEAVYADD